jgi:UDP-glucose 4-epimerase
VDAHVKALGKAESGKVGIYNVGTGKGSSPQDPFQLFYTSLVENHPI